MSDLLRPKGIKKPSRTGIAAAYKREKRAAAEKRQLKYSKLTKAEKLAKLDAGGFAASKQRDKLNREEKNV